MLRAWNFLSRAKQSYDAHRTRQPPCLLMLPNHQTQKFRNEPQADSETKISLSVSLVEILQVSARQLSFWREHGAGAYMLGGKKLAIPRQAASKVTDRPAGFSSARTRDPVSLLLLTSCNRVPWYLVARGLHMQHVQRTSYSKPSSGGEETKKQRNKAKCACVVRVWVASK
jgi:hypothetical protein